MRRREFIAGLGSAAAWPVAARAQQPAVPVIALINGAAAGGSADFAAAFRRGLRGNRLRRGPERGDRVPLAGGPIRSPSRADG